MNKIILMGRLTRDPEIRYSQGENSMAVGRFSIAVDRKYQRDEDIKTDFFNCITFGKLAEFVEKYLKKGIKIVVTGRIQNNNYTNKNGEKVYSIQIIADEIEFAESKAASQRNNADNGQPSALDVTPDGFMSIPAGFDDLPFN